MHLSDQAKNLHHKLIMHFNRFRSKIFTNVAFLSNDYLVLIFEIFSDDFCVGFCINFDCHFNGEILCDLSSFEIQRNEKEGEDCHKSYLAFEYYHFHSGISLLDDSPFQSLF